MILLRLPALYPVALRIKLVVGVSSSFIYPAVRTMIVKFSWNAIIAGEFIYPAICCPTVAILTSDFNQATLPPIRVYRFVGETSARL